MSSFIINAIWVAILTPAAVTVLAHLYLLLRRSWPPLKTKTLGLLTALAITPLISLPYITSVQDSLLPPITRNCKAITPSALIALSLAPLVLTIRLRRFHQILIKHKSNLPSATSQVIKLSMFFYSLTLLTSAYYALAGITSELDENNLCSALYEEVLPAPLAVVANAGLMIAGLSGLIIVPAMMYYAIKLRKVRAQFNEFRQNMALVALNAAAFTLCVLIFYDSFGPAVFGLVFVPIVSYWVMLGYPFYYTITNNQDYLNKYTYGFSTMPTPEELKASLADQLNIPELREKFREFAGKRFAVENLEFYEACIELDNVVDWFDRQASVMSIISTFIQPGSEKEINISSKTRKDILGSDDLNNPALMDRARGEILAVMETDLAPEFQGTKSMTKLAQAAEEEAREIASLQAMGLASKGVESLGASARKSSVTRDSNGGTKSRSGERSLSDAAVDRSVRGGASISNSGRRTSTSSQPQRAAPPSTPKPAASMPLSPMAEEPNEDTQV